MRLEIISVKDSGNLQRERVVIKVLQATDVGGHLLCDTTYSDESSVSNKVRHVFWFPDKLVNTGDFVVLFSGPGKDTQSTNMAGTLTHKFYWGLKETVWNKEGDAAVLFEIADWVSKRIASSKVK